MDKKPKQPDDMRMPADDFDEFTRKALGTAPEKVENPARVFKPCPSSEERPDLYDDYDFTPADKPNTMPYLMDRFNKRMAEARASDKPGVDKK